MNTDHASESVSIRAAPVAKSPRRVWHWVLLVMAILVGGLWIRSSFAGDVLALCVGREARVQVLASSGGRMCLALTNISLGRERSWTLLHLAGDQPQSLLSMLDTSRINAHPAIGSSSSPASPLGDGFHGFSFAGTQAGVLMNVPNSKVAYVTFPHWALILVLTAAGLWGLFSPAYRRRMRLARGLCGQCGYDLRAGHKRCPECGTATTMIEV
jgi:hypothetical protein